MNESILKTGFATFDKLLNGTDTSGGIRCPEGKGLLGVVFGEAGAGKSILGLQLCCRWLLSGGITGNDFENGPRFSIYIAHDKPAVSHSKARDHFKYFISAKEKPSPPIAWASKLDDLSKPKSELLHGCIFLQFPLEIDEQRQFLEDVIDTVDDAVQRGAGKKKPQILLCLDNANAISDVALRAGFFQSGQRSNNLNVTPSNDELHALSLADDNFYNRLRRVCSEKRFHLFLMEEEDNPPMSDAFPDRLRHVASSSLVVRQAYAADIVVRLGTRQFSTGYKERFIEILKARNNYFYRGKHHFSIVSDQGGNRVNTDVMPSSRDKQPDYGLVIFPSVSTQLAWLAQKSKTSNPPWKLPTEPLSIGIELLDEEIRSTLSTGGKGYLRPGSSSVLVADLDSKATEIAIHFAAEADKALYLSFLHDSDKLEEICKRFRETKQKTEEKPEKEPKKITWQYLPPEHVSEGKLLQDIDNLILDIEGTEGCSSDVRVVVDNLFELKSKYPLFSDHNAFVAVLVELFRRRKVTSLIVDMVEAGEAHNPIENSAAAGLVDNVCLLRHVEFPGGPRRVFSIQKLAVSATPEPLWDLVESGGDGSVIIKAQRTFDLYKNVLSGRPEPISIQFTLYDEEPCSPFRTYIDALMKVLRGSMGCRIRPNLYGSPEYPRVRRILDIQSGGQRADCHIVALDEFWLKELIQNDSLEDLSPYIHVNGENNGENSDFSWENYMTFAHSMAIFLKKDGKPDAADFKPFFAIPARNNCGLLCCDPALIAHLTGRIAGLSSNLTRWRDRQENEFTWDNLLELKSKWEQLKKPIKNFRPNGGEGLVPAEFFTFCMDQIESSVCFFLELALSHAERDIIIDSDDKFVFTKEGLSKPLCMLVRLIDNDSLSHLAERRFRLSSKEPSSLFSRQWWSTMGCLRERMDEQGQPECAGYFRRLKGFELPRGTIDGKIKEVPTPVSGTWYLGILKGSIAVNKGWEVIRIITSTNDELFKMDNYIGLPTRARFYDPSAASFRLPYAKQYNNLRNVHSLFRDKPAENLDTFRTTVVNSVCPFFRMSISNYDDAAPIIWRMLVHMAEVVRNSPDLLDKRIGELMGRADSVVEWAKGEYDALTNRGA